MKLQVDGDFARAGRSHNLVGVFVFVELRSPVKPGMTCKLDMTMLFPDAKVAEDVDEDVLAADAF